jgi:hypothetical protein
MQNIKLDVQQTMQARELLKEMAGNLSSVGVQFQADECLGFSKYDGVVIQQLLLNGLIISYDIHEMDEINVIHFIKLTELGSALSLCSRLAVFWNEGIDSEISFIATGNLVYSIFNKYDENEIDHLVKLLTMEEQEAFQRYYKTQIWSKNQTTEEEDEYGCDSDSESAPSLSAMFELSVELGPINSDAYRTNDYVLKKCMEELGELSLEEQIETGLSYKEPGKDGVAGEAVDLAICAMDMFALQHPGLTASEIEDKFISYMNIKLQKWRTVVGK